MEFADDNSYNSTIQMTPFKALYSRKCRLPIGWFELGESRLIALDIMRDADEKVQKIRDRMLAAQSRQQFYTDPKR